MLTIVLSLLLLQSPEGLRLDEAGGPLLPEKDDNAQLAVVVFEVEIGADGSLIRNNLVQGAAQFIERSRRALRAWKFAGVDPKSTPVHASVVFLYRPRLELPDKSRVFDQPLPPGFDGKYLSPFPIRVVDPGYPVGAFGEGSVILQAATTPEGTVETVNVISNLPSLSESAAAAVRDWKFHLPNTKPNGRGISIVVVTYRSPRYKQ